MINYNQKYKNELIVTLECNDGVNLYDSNLTSNKIFYAIGSKTSNDLSLVSQVKHIYLWCVKPDAVINFKGGGTFEILDDDGHLININYDRLQNAQGTRLKQEINNLKFTNNDSNIRFTNSNENSLTLDINDLDDKSNVLEFNATVTVPSDVKCNYTTGTHQFINNQPVNILFDGNIRKDDTITIKRNGRSDINTTINFDTDLAFSTLGMDNVNNMEIIYKHTKEENPKPKPEPQTVTFMSSDDGIKWTNTEMKDTGTDFNNSIVIQKGYELRSPLAVEVTDKQDQITTLTYGRGQTIHYDGDDTTKNTWDLTISTGYKKLNIKAGQSKYKQYKLIPTLQNAKVIIPEATDDKYGNTKYYLDPKHTTITLQSNDGYTFENDGSLTYTKNDLDQETLTIKATHTNTVTVTLPTDIDWSVQKDFELTMGAVKSEIVENTGGFTNIYKADYTNLLKFSNEVILKTVGGSTGNLQAYDVTPYINNLVLLPFNVPSGEKSNIVAGNEIFKTQLSTVDNNYLNVDLGNITVPETYKNGYDYYNVKTRLMLPYTNMIELDPVHVINQTVSIKYIVNVVNGDTTINLLNGDDLFYSEQVNLASEVPFISNARKGTQYAVINRLKTVFKNSINQAYIIIEQPTPILNSEYYPTNEKGTLKGYNGNVKCTLLNNMNINVNELNTLQNLLNNGVNIK